MSWSWELRPRGLYRLLSPELVPVGRRAEQTNWGRLKRFLEGQEELEAERGLRRIKR
jgi:hypothetical protein